MWREILEGKSGFLSGLVVSLEADYALLYKTLKMEVLRWFSDEMEHVRHVAEYRYALAAMDAQVVDQDIYLRLNGH